jgi:ABC-type antimicrobial peptide transport system permease subunit
VIQLVLEALGVLNANRTRTALTMLGLVIGVTAVIAIQVAGAGLEGAIDGTLGAFNDRSFTLVPNTRQGDFTRARIKYEDVLAAKRAVPNIAEGIPFGANARVVHVGHHRARLQIGGEADARYVATPLRFGRAFDVAEIADAAHVCVLSDNAYTKLYPDGGDPTGTSIGLGDRRYVIVGVFAKPNGVQIDITRQDISIPYTTFGSDFAHGAFLFGARFIVDDTGSLAATESATTAFFSKLKGGHVEYQTIDKRSISQGISGIIGAVTFLVAIIGAVSLVVAGIGILNIMLVSVAERTREIGIRKAIGATRGQVLLQFFVEALLISLIGCLIGMLFGVTIGALVNQFALVKISGMVPAIPWLRSIAIAVGFATLVTLAFGTYPAWRAARLDPIEALRYE